MELSTSFGGFSKNFGFQEIIRSGSSSSSSLVLDSEKGELVRAMMRPGQKGVKADKALEALRNHSEAERRRRERINGHLASLRSLIPGTDKMDKASLLAETITHVKELRKNAAEATKGVLLPMDMDEVKVEEEYGSDGAAHAIKASLCCDYKCEILSDIRQAFDALHLKTLRAEIATLGSRMICVLVLACCKEQNADGRLASSISHTLSSILDKFYASEQCSSRNTVSNKRRRIAFMDSSSSSSFGDFW